MFPATSSLTEHQKLLTEMNIYIDYKTPGQIRETAIIQQTTFWAEVKKRQGLNPMAFNFSVKDIGLCPTSNGSLVSDDILVLIQHFDQENSIAYIPYGPRTEPGEEYQGLFLEEFSEILRSFLPENCILIRYDLPWESPWAKDDDCFDFNGNWKGRPEKKNQELRFNFNTRNWNLKKTNSDILPSNTIFLDLKKDIDTLLGKMKPKTRYNIRLSERRGVKIKPVGLDKLDTWYELYRETAARNGFFLHDIDYFRTVLLARRNPDTRADAQLLVAFVDETPLAAMFLAISGKRGTYLYGASSSINRNYMATYALQWEAIIMARQKGCTEYDLFGVAPNPDPSHPLHGLYRYKSGFGGQMYHRVGCWDYPLDHEKYSLFQSMEMCSQGYHVN